MVFLLCSYFQCNHVQLQFHHILVRVVSFSAMWKTVFETNHLAKNTCFLHRCVFTALSLIQSIYFNIPQRLRREATLRSAVDAVMGMDAVKGLDAVMDLDAVTATVRITHSGVTDPLADMAPTDMDLTADTEDFIRVLDLSTVLFHIIEQGSRFCQTRTRA